MTFIEILAILAGLIVISWLVLRRTVRKRLERSTAKIKEETEKLKKEIYHKKEMRKHLGYYMEREEFTPSLSEEEKELTEVQIQDEDEELESEKDDC